VSATLYKGHPIADRTAPDLRLEATEELPSLPGLEHFKDDRKAWEQAYRDRYREQARLILSALVQSLPGGTIDALLSELLEHRRLLLVVPAGRTLV
jgi:hypothetical protein